MGYSKRLGTEITDFWPDDTETEMYIASTGQSILELLTTAQEKWPDAKAEDVHIRAEHIHTSCIYYDLHDPSDYTNFIVLEYRPS